MKGAEAYSEFLGVTEKQKEEVKQEIEEEIKCPECGAHIHLEWKDNS